MKKEKVIFNVNGEAHELLVEPNALLLNVLRDELGLTGAKYACGVGQSLQWLRTEPRFGRSKGWSSRTGRSILSRKRSSTTAQSNAVSARPGWS